MNTSQFREMLEQYPQLKQDLFIRGFLVTDREIENLDAFPFYGNWQEEIWGGWHFLTHRLTGFHIHGDDQGRVFFLLGHAYDPFAMEHEEDKLLRRLAGAYGTDSFMDRIHDLTGVFVLGWIDNGLLQFLVDPSGMQSAAWGKVDQGFYLTSHPQLVGDLCGLQMDSFVRELTQYKWYGRIMGPYLPADLTPFSPLKRVIPSTCYRYDGELSHKRFWPLVSQTTADTQEEYDALIREGAEILKKNMMLVAQKWEKPWISLTGGIDSNTTFAAANGSYHRFESFSYISAEKEEPDAAAARTIAARFDLPHHEYRIPDSNEDMALFEQKRELFRHNNGYVAELYDNEARKKFFLREHAGCDVEVKSWVSETIRGYWYKHYGRTTMPKLSGKLYRNLYKIFLENRALARKIDRLFDAYIEAYEYRHIPDCYPPADMHYNEVTWGSWGGLNITEMKYCFDITFIYNNRRFLDLMFRVPLEKRISDRHHLDMKKYLNPELYDMGIRVVNMKETKFRAFALNVIFTINSWLPF